MVETADQVSMLAEELVAEIDSLLEFVANNSIGEYVKTDQMNDVLLDVRQKIVKVSEC